MLDLKPNGDQTTASYHCNSAAPDMGIVFRADGRNQAEMSLHTCPTPPGLEVMAAALVLNFCFFGKSQLAILLALVLL